MRKWLIEKLLMWALYLEWPNSKGTFWVERHYDHGRNYLVVYTGDRMKIERKRK
jgi:hypothetical protein